MMGHKDKTSAPTSTHTILHKKIHFHLNSQNIAQKDTLPHQLTVHCTKRYTDPTSTYTILHKKIHFHINSQNIAQKDILPPYQPTQSCTKIYTAQINSHYTQKEKLILLLTSTHTKLHIWFASLITTDHTTNFYRLHT